ncbi:MAG: cysteine desulfurase, partial [Candidatus Hydrogenedens sp.]|nr:cysteine desulfurase [Candidatus Hydrogenedens sp.]
MKKKSPIYADNAATAPLSERAFEAMLPFLRDQYGNASSMYTLGVQARRGVEKARKQIADALNCEAAEIVFNSGGSEGNNWIIKGVAERFREGETHIITTAVEHPSVLGLCRLLEEKGVRLTVLPVDSGGRINPGDVEKALCPETRLVSVMMANNEVGTIQPVAEIGALLNDRGILFHSDAVQAMGQIPVDVSALQVDFLSASAHKFNGPKGMGFVYKRAGVELPSLIIGGGQEKGQRAGTENVAGIVAMGVALEENVAHMQRAAEIKTELVAATVSALRNSITSVEINGDPEHRLPGIVNLSFKKLSGEVLVNLLSLKGICISASSACAAAKNQSSHVLR